MLDIFRKKHLQYYEMLEADFIKTLRYVELNEKNFNTDSKEYTKQLQTICSEVENVLAYLSTLKQKNNINRASTNEEHGYVILNSFEGWDRVTIAVKGLDKKIKPWFGWSFDANENLKLPNWWSTSRYIQENRKDVNGIHDIQASLENVINALAALYYINRLTERELCFKEQLVIKGTNNLSEIFKVYNVTEQ